MAPCMNQTIFKAVIGIALAAAIAAAQTPNAQAYIFQGIGSTRYSNGIALGQTAGGGQGVFWKGLGAGAEIGAVYPYRSLEGAIGIANVSAVYHFTAGRDTKWDPFVAGGYTLLFRSGAASGYHFGGGVTYWFHRHLGVRVEFRDQRARYADFAFPMARFGLSFR